MQKKKERDIIKWHISIVSGRNVFNKYEGVRKGILILLMGKQWLRGFSQDDVELGFDLGLYDFKACLHHLMLPV